MPGPADLFAQIQSRNKKKEGEGGDGTTTSRNNPLLAQIQAKQQAAAALPPMIKTTKNVVPKTTTTTTCPEGKLFHYDESLDSFLFDLSKKEPFVLETNNNNVVVVVPLAPCIYRMTDYTFFKKEPIERKRCLLKLGVLRCLARECKVFNHLLWSRLQKKKNQDNNHGTMEEEELGKVRFMELLSNCGIYQKVSELILQLVAKAAAAAIVATAAGGSGSSSIPQIRVDGLNDFLQTLEDCSPSLVEARDEIENNQSVTFYPGLGELFTPGSKLVCHPDGMEGVAMGCSCVQSWYTEEVNPAIPHKVKRRFVLVIEFLVSVGDELVFVAASEVYPEFHNNNDDSRSVPIKDLTHRKLCPDQQNPEDLLLLRRLQQRGTFYASVATKNHYLEYQPHSFFPIRSSSSSSSGGWSSTNNTVRPLSKGGRIMVDVKRAILENHIPIRTSSSSSSGVDGMSDTVKEAIKLFEQSKRTGVAVPFRTAILVPPTSSHSNSSSTSSSTTTTKATTEDDDDDFSSGNDYHQLWQAWPMLTGFSFTARVWGKLLLTLPKQQPTTTTDLGTSGSCGYIDFQEQAFEQLVLADDKKELIRAVARNAGSSSGGGGGLDNDDDDSDDDDDDIGLDVIANKGAASIVLLHGPPGCGKTLTAEAIAELLKKPLYVVTAGDLGITASEVERTLGAVLELCQTWDALVLMDEADVFLESRSNSSSGSSSNDLQRNALVCVMLRLLEYYSGCLFLSSNRSASASSIDAAIASRITVMLGYPPLDTNGRAKVWKNLIELVPLLPSSSSSMKDDKDDTMMIVKKKKKKKTFKYRENFTSTDYESLATNYLLNGRQIKNSIVLARALARERKLPLSLVILKRAVTAVAGEEASIATTTSTRAVTVE